MVSELSLIPVSQACCVIIVSRLATLIVAGLPLRVASEEAKVAALISALSRYESSWPLNTTLGLRVKAVGAVVESVCFWSATSVKLDQPTEAAEFDGMKLGFVTSELIKCNFTSLAHLDLSGLNRMNLGTNSIKDIVMGIWSALQTLELDNHHLEDVSLVSLATGKWPLMFCKLRNNDLSVEAMPIL